MYAIYAAAMVVALALIAGPAGAQTAGRDMDYKDGSVQLEGYLATPRGATGKQPAVMILHDWNGLDSYEKMRADMLAKLGYIAFAADVYGKGVRPESTDESRTEASKYYKDPELLRARARAGLDYLKSLPDVDPVRVAVIGYCFGGTAALELARSGAACRALATFHGGLDTTMPAQKGAIKPELLILHGGADRSVTADKVANFVKEMIGAGVHFEFISYPGAPHAFTVPGPAYREEADKQSWQRMKEFLDRFLGPQGSP